jgi:hypothetical protein
MMSKICWLTKDETDTSLNLARRRRQFRRSSEKLRVFGATKIGRRTQRVIFHRQIDFLHQKIHLIVHVIAKNKTFAKTRRQSQLHS